jgi:flagellar biosynthesis/type III secretory pathway chaperone
MDVLAEQLSDVLDDQIRHLERRRMQLRSLTDSIVERDERGLESLLERIEQALNTQAELDRRLDAVRSGIADALLEKPDRVTLGGVVEALDEPQRGILADRRRRLIEAVEAFQQQHLHTSVLLLESVRINRMMLEAVFPGSRGLATYDPGGHDSWRPDTGLVDAER